MWMEVYLFNKYLNNCLVTTMCQTLYSHLCNWQFFLVICYPGNNPWRWAFPPMPKVIVTMGTFYHRIDSCWRIQRWEDWQTCPVGKWRILVEKMTQDHLKGILLAKSGTIWALVIIMHYIPLNKIRIHEITLLWVDTYIHK